MKILHIITLLLVLIGGINWGLVGITGLNIVSTIFGAGIITTIIYILVAISSIYHIFPMITKHFEAAS